ncbi:MAG: signal peptide peptidase SppA [Candidatus Zixiibacteriota bacterium]|nr:MAG: signal peptide peptidase SppA [candidate division Zixibacteria bacterium]
MARKRDVVIGAIIAVSFVIVIGFFGLLFYSFFVGEGDVSLGGFGARVAVVEVFGVIEYSEDIVRQLKRWGETDNVKAIVLHINSPGGAVAPSQEIYDEILRIRYDDGKIVVASMSSVAASGGYYISCAADQIMANPGTITGSIGVIMQILTAEKLMKTIGISYEVVKSGQLKDVGILDRAMSEHERRMLTSMVMDTHEQFVEAVAEGRSLEKEEIYPLADGSVFSGRQAVEIGLIDTLGGFEDAVRYAAELAGIKGEPKTVKVVKPKPSFFDLLGSLLGKADNAVSGLQSTGPRILYLY